MIVATAATAFSLIWLVWILCTTIARGFQAVHLKLFTQMTPPPGEDGGLLNAIYGSAVMVLIAIAIGTPLGIAAGTYLSEYARARRTGQAIRFINDILLSAPSIVLGLFVYTLIVRRVGHFSGWLCGVALALILIPVVVRTTDEMLQLSLRHARGGAVTRNTAVEGHHPCPLPRRDARYRHRLLAGGRAHQRRDRTAAVHGPQ